MNIHPKVAYPTLVMLALTIVMLALQQYAPNYMPSAALTTAINGFISALVGYAAPSPTTPSQ